MMNLEFLKKKKFRDAFFFAVMAAFPLAQFAVFYVGVNINSILNSFRIYDVDGSFVWTGFSNFKTMFDMLKYEVTLQYAVKNSLIAYACFTLVGTTLALLFSFYIYKKFAGSGFFKTILFLPQIISTIVMVILYTYLVDRMIPEFALRLFKIEMPGLLEKTQTRFAAIIVYNIWVSFGANILLYVSAMTGIEDSVVEAARLDGAVGIKEFFYITLPSIYPTLTTFIVVGIVGIFTDQVNVYSFYGGEADAQLYTLGYFMFKKVAGAKTMLEFPIISSMGLMMTIIAVPLTMLVRYLMERFGPSAETRTK